MLFAAIFIFVTARSMETASVPKEKDIYMDMIRFPVDDQIVFDPKPARPQAPLQNRFGDDGVHESCKHQSFCTIMPPNYPERKFNDMFKGYKIPPMPTVDVIDNRQGDPSYDDSCEALPTFEPLYKVRPKRDEDAWRTVIQAPSHNFIQQIRLETCQSTGSCFKPFLDTNPDLETACIQMYTVWELLVETEDGKSTERIKAELPTCCSCKFKPIKFGSRFGETPVNKTKVTSRIGETAANKTKAKTN